MCADWLVGSVKGQRQHRNALCVPHIQAFPKADSPLPQEGMLPLNSPMKCLACSLSAEDSQCLRCRGGSLGLEHLSPDQTLSHAIALSRSFCVWEPLLPQQKTGHDNPTVLVGGLLLILMWTGFVNADMLKERKRDTAYDELWPWTTPWARRSRSLWGRDAYWSHCIDEETEAYKMTATFLNHTRASGGDRDWI